MDRPLLRYFGGKFRVAPWIISHFPEHRIYVELFGGGASVLLRKPRSYAEVYNDLDSQIVGVFRCFQSDFDKLSHRLKNTPFSREEYDLAYVDTDDSTEMAARTIIRSWMGFGNSAQRAGGKTGFQSMTELTGSSKANQWKTYLDIIEQFRERLLGVVIENRDAFEVIDQQDTADTLFFADPPYVPITRKSGEYRHEMTIADHERLCAKLSSIKGMAVLCGYENEIYDRLGWCKEHLITNSMASVDRSRTEVIWISPAARNRQVQKSLFAEAAER